MQKGKPMAKFHINPATGNPGRCLARSGNCPFGGEDAHYSTKEEARLAYEQQMERNSPQTESKNSPTKLLEDRARRLINYDPLLEAEKITGNDYREDRDTQILSMLLLQEASKDKRALLGELGDTHDHMSFDEVLQIFRDQGFVPVQETSYTSYGDSQERQVVMWSDEGILAVANSFRGNVNSSSIYFNWRANDEDPYYHGDLPLSGGYIHEALDREPQEYIFAGKIDTRNGLANTLGKLRSHGRFLEEWEQRPHLWLLTFEDEHAEAGEKRITSLGKINGEKIKQLPEELLTKLGRPQFGED